MAGDGSNPRVGYSNEYLTDSPIEHNWANTRFGDLARDGQTYSLSTTTFTALTTINQELPMLHIANDSSGTDILVHAIHFGGDQLGKWLLYKGVTTGTIIDNTVAGKKENLTGSSNTIDATVYQGVDGDTITDGTVINPYIVAIGGRDITFGSGIVIRAGGTLTLSVEMPVAGVACVSVDVGFSTL